MSFKSDLLRFAVSFFDERRALCGKADYTGNRRELLIDFRTVAPVRARYVRLDLTPPHTPGLRRGVNNFTVFGFFDETN